MRTYLLLLPLLLLVLPFRAQAQSPEVKKYVNAAIALYENLEYEKALRQLQKARLKSTGAEDDARISLVEGIIYAEMGKEDKADTAFKTGFSLDPDIKLPVEVSPKVEAVANKARENVRKMLAPQIEKQRQEDEAKKQAELERQKAEDDRKKEEEHHRQEEEMHAKTNSPPPLGPLYDPHPFRTPGLITGIAGVVVTGVGVGLLIVSNNELSALNHPMGTGVEVSPTPAEAKSYHDNGPMLEGLGWGLLGVGAAAIVAGVVLFLLPNFDAPADAPKASFYVTPHSAGFGLTFALP